MIERFQQSAETIGATTKRFTIKREEADYLAGLAEQTNALRPG